MPNYTCVYRTGTGFWVKFNVGRQTTPWIKEKSKQIRKMQIFYLTYWTHWIGPNELLLLGRKNKCLLFLKEFHNYMMCVIHYYHWILTSVPWCLGLVPTVGTSRPSYPLWHDFPTVALAGTRFWKLQGGPRLADAWQVWR